MQIRLMRDSDLDFAVQCAQNEGWVSETREVFEGFFLFEPGGCFVAESDGRSIGLCVAVCYEEYGFFGELIVLPEYRSEGAGRALLDHAVNYQKGRGVQNILLDGVVKAVSLYERAGFKKVCRSLRFLGKIERCEPHESVRQMLRSDLPDIFRMDREAFGEDRQFFLERIFGLCPAFCKVMEEKGRITGFVMARCKQTLIAAGPWVVSEDSEHPERLIEALAMGAPEKPVRLGILEANQRAIEVARRLGLREENSEPPWRMVLGNKSDLGMSAESLAIGSPAKG